MAKWLMMAGISLFFAGFLWHWGSKLGLGSLPGDFTWKRGTLTLYFPLTSCLIFSLLASLLLWVARR